MIYGSNGCIKFNDVSIIVTLAIWRQRPERIKKKKEKYNS